MKKKLLIILFVAAIACMLAFSVSASPAKPDLGVSFGDVQTIPNFTPPSQKYVGTTERVLLYDGTNYVTYPTYYITKDSTTFEMTFDAINGVTEKGYNELSVVMVEAPTGITHFKAYTFSGYTSVVYCKVPGTVVKYGNGSWSAAFESCSWIRMIEFVDGTTPLDNTMFGSNMFSGCSALEYVKLPNNLKTTGGSLFNACKSLKTVIFGTGFETLPSSGGNFAGADDKSKTSHKELYISAKFGGDGVTLNNQMFVWTSKETSDDAPKMIFYYTGTKAQAEALQTKALATENNGKLAYATIVSIDDFVRANAEAGKNYIVYGYNVCDAFYNGQHVEDNNTCTITCSQCGANGVAEKNPIHNFTSTYEYKNGYTQNGVETSVCENAGCIYCAENEPKVVALAPIFKDFKYSVRDDDKFGIVMEYDIDTDALAIYEAGASTTVNFGVVAIAEHKYNSEKDLVKVDGTTEQTNIILANVSGKGSQTVSLIINGAESQWNQHKTTEFYILGYAINAGTVEYFQNTSKNNFADLDTISYDQAKGAVA